MSLKVGIVGLPNAGKSTLFNALTRQAALARNVPFTTIEPNVGVVPVPDERLGRIANISGSKRVVPTTVEFVDIAGLVKNAHKGEGLGNQFLAHIREVDAIVHVVRGFADGNIIHVEGSVDPERDLATIRTELALADLETVERAMERNEHRVKSNEKGAQERTEELRRLQQALAEGNAAPDTVAAHDLHLLTAKPSLVVVNAGERDEGAGSGLGIDLCVKIEQELSELPEEERAGLMASYNMKEPGLNRLIRESYRLLNLITFFTTGPNETRAWTVKRESTAPKAAATIHSDFERAFIRAETIDWKTYAEAGSYANARERGVLRQEGKDYVVQDGDILLIKAGV